MRIKLLISFLCVSLIFVRCADPKDDFSEFDSPEDFDSPPSIKPTQHQQQEQTEQKPETTVKKPPKDEVGNFRKKNVI